MKKDWYKVFTGSGGSEYSGSDIFLGTFYGYVDEIALKLANKQRGFYCDGHLSFQKTVKPNTDLPKKLHDKVNVVIVGKSWVADRELVEATKFFKGRPVTVQDCNQYAAVTIVRKKNGSNRTKNKQGGASRKVS